MSQDWRKLIETLVIPALVIDQSGIVVALNSAMASALGTERRSVEGTALVDVLGDPSLASILDEENSAGHEVQVTSAEGSERNLVLSLAASSADGHQLVTGLDVTERCMREAALQEECERYRDMATAGSDTLHETTEQMGAVRASLKLWGSRHRDGRVFSHERRITWPDDIVDMSYEPEALEKYFELIRARAPYRDVIYRIKRDDGRELYTRASAVPFYDRNGEFAGYRGISIDVTKQVLAERALKESREKLTRSEEHLVRAQRVSATGSAEFDLMTKKSAWSEGMYRLLGATRDSLDTTSLSDLRRFIHPDDWEVVRAGLIDMANGTAPTPHEYRIVRPDGSVAIVYSEAEIVRDASGQPVRAISILKDITELRTRIKELEDARARLQQQGVELAAAAAELAKARDAATDASEAKSAFLANMSHELRTPLNAILGFSEVIATAQFGEISDRYQSYGGYIHASGQHLLELINQILDLSKVEAGRMEVVEDEFAPDEIILDCQSLLAERAAKAGLCLCVDFPADLPQLRADKLKFKQVLLNLISNAIKFTPRDGRVCVCAHVSVEGFDVVVSDTGVGMKAEDIPLALQPFRQVGDDRRHKQQGTGLGLPLAKALVEMHDGRFEIVSEPRKGTIVTATFPHSRIIRTPVLASAS